MVKTIQYINILRFVVKLFFILFLISMLLLMGFILVTTYEDFTSELLTLYSKQDKIVEFRTSYLTKEVFLYFRILTTVSLLLLVYINLKLSIVSEFAVLKIVSFCASIKKFFNYLLEQYTMFSFVEKAIFFTVIILLSIVKIYFMSRFCLNVDEISSYLFFVKRGFWVSASYYPSPNNHIFYSILVWLSQPFFSDPYYLIKTPSFIIGILTAASLMLFLTKYFNFLSSVLGTLIFSFATHYFLYSISGRGYALMTSFAIVTTFLTIEILSGKNEKFIWVMYVIASILGFYTMIIFLYPFVTLSLVLFIYYIQQRKYAFLKTFIYYNLLIVLGVLLLYTPVFLISGVSAITSNPWMIHLEWNDYFTALPGFIEGAFIQIIDIDHKATFVGLVVIIVALAILWKTKKRYWFWVIVAFFTVPIILMTIQRLQPYGRVWTYLIFPFSMCMLFIIDYLFSLVPKYKNLLLIFSSFFVFISSIVHFYTISNNGAGLYDDVTRISAYIASEKKATIYTNDDSYNLFIRFEGSKIGKEIFPLMGNVTDLGKLDYVLIVPGTLFPHGVDRFDYVLKEKNKYIEVYKLKL